MDPTRRPKTENKKANGEVEDRGKRQDPGKRLALALKPTDIRVTLRIGNSAPMSFIKETPYAIGRCLGEQTKDFQDEANSIWAYCAKGIKVDPPSEPETSPAPLNSSIHRSIDLKIGTQTSMTYVKGSDPFVMANYYSEQDQRFRDSFKKTVASRCDEGIANPETAARHFAQQDASYHAAFLGALPDDLREALRNHQNPA